MATDLRVITDEEVLTELGCSVTELLGKGGEAQVYGSDESTIIRILRKSIDKQKFNEWVALVNFIHTASSEVSFNTPKINRTFEIGGRIGTIEDRYLGRTLSSVLSQTSDEEEKIHLVLGWLAAAAEIQSIEISSSDYGDLIQVSERSENPESWHKYWHQKLSDQLNKRGELYKSVNAYRIAKAMPEPDEPRLVHLDIFSGNLLWDNQKVSAVLDFGTGTIMGDGRLNALFAAVFILETDSCKTKNIRETVNLWLKDRDLLQYYKPAREMQAAYWSFVDDDGDLDQWCRQVLLQCK